MSPGAVVGLGGVDDHATFATDHVDANLDVLELTEIGLARLGAEDRADDRVELAELEDSGFGGSSRLRP